MAKIHIQRGPGKSENFRQWDNLINNIAEGNVIPVIGPEFLVDDVDYPHTHNAHTILLSELSEYYGLDKVPTSFSELFFELKSEERFEFYSTLGDVYDNGFHLEPSQLLRELLSINQFPFVITTSFTPVVEDAMRDIWGNDLKVMTFVNDPQLNDNINSDEDIRKPTLFYMFGKVNRSKGTYVVTDTDMLAFCKSWLTDKSPELLSAVLKSKYLLFLGNNYSDWLCRFVWYSLKSSFDKNPGMMVDSLATDSLLQFLKRIDAFTQSDPKYVIDEIKRRLSEKFGSNEDIRFKNVMQRADVFISYSRTDKDVAERLYKALTDRGLTVWYDRLSLGKGDKFMREIRQGIRTAHFFVPIITANVERERNDAHVYRQEWKTAIERAEEYGRTFIYPLAEQGFDFYNSSLPEELQQHNAAFYSPDDPDFTELADTLKADLDRILNDK